MNQIITIKEIKGFSRVRAKVGWGGVGGHSGRDLVVGGAVWGGPGGLS